MTDIHAFDVHADLVAFLTDARVQQEATQADVADAAGVHLVTIGCWERQTKEPSVSYLLAWAWALGYDLALVPQPKHAGCTEPGCKRKATSKGKCHPCYMRGWRAERRSR